MNPQRRRRSRERPPRRQRLGNANLRATPLAADEHSAEAVRRLRRSYRAGAVVDLLAAAGMTVPALYGPTLRFRRGMRRSRPEFAYAMRTAAPLMLGWTLLLLWADRDPLARRGVLPLTVAPVIAGLVANDADAARRGWIAPKRCPARASPSSRASGWSRPRSWALERVGRSARRRPRSLPMSIAFDVL